MWLTGRDSQLPSQQRGVSPLGVEWDEDKPEGKGGKSLFRRWGASGDGIWRMSDTGSPDLGRVQPPPFISPSGSSGLGCPEGCSCCGC